LRNFLFCLALLGAAAHAAEPVSAEPGCVKEGNYKTLGFDAFDQDMNGGWRKIANVPGCEQVAADVIKDYRAFLEGRMSILFWHEAQLRANSGDYAPAIKLMRQSYKDQDFFGWNHYVTATIAFLKNDKKSLLKARKRLAALPDPAERRCVDITGKTITCDAWPPNLDVVDGLITCFGKPYRDASEWACRPAVKTP
jgi:hypothetical protein